MKHLTRLISVAVLSAVASVAHAATVRVDFSSTLFDTRRDKGYDSNIQLSYPGVSTKTVSAGLFSGRVSNLNGIAASDFVYGTGSFYAYCYDLYEFLKPGQVVTSYTIDMDGAQARTLDFLGAVNHALSSVRGFYDPYAWLNPLNSSMAAAIQIGIWESLYDSTGWSLSSGSFRVRGGARQATTDWYSTFVNALTVSDALDGSFVMTMTAKGAQDLITGVVPPKPAEPTPTPVDPTPVDPTPVDPTPVDPTPVDPTPVDPLPVDPNPIDPLPIDPNPVDPNPVDPTQPTEVPEPASLALLGVALSGLALARRRRRA